MEWETTESDVLEWAKRTGAPLTEKGNVGVATIEAWNEAHPFRQYARSLKERAELGGLLNGILILEDEFGRPVEVRGRNLPD